MAGLIICGVDDSDSAKGAARVARGLSSKLGLGLVFLRVVESGASKETVSAITERLERVCGPASEVDNGARWLVDEGHPAERLVAAAAAEEASMIVVGSTGPRSSLLGSISAEVSKRAPCPVVVVPPGGDLAATGRDATARLTRRSRAASFASVSAPRRRLPRRISRADRPLQLRGGRYRLRSRDPVRPDHALGKRRRRGSAATDRHERSCSRVEAKRLQRSGADQAADGRHAVGDGVRAGTTRRQLRRT